MTIQEAIDALIKVPEHRRSEELKIYIDGPLSGFLRVDEVRLDPDKNYINVTARCPFQRINQKTGEAK